MDRNVAGRLCACGCGRRPRNPAAEYVRGHRPPVPLAERLWRRVDKSGDCWLWLGHRNRSGYGQIGLGRKEEGIALAHRVAYELTIGQIPEGQYVCHHCDNPPCVRPEHLFLGSQKDNMHGASIKGRVKGATGLSNWNARLSSDEVERIRLLDESGVERKETARLFGITPQHVGAIARRDARKVA